MRLIEYQNRFGNYKALLKLGMVENAEKYKSAIEYQALIALTNARFEDRPKDVQDKLRIAVSFEHKMDNLVWSNRDKQIAP